MSISSPGTIKATTLWCGWTLQIVVILVIVAHISSRISRRLFYFVIDATFILGCALTTSLLLLTTWAVCAHEATEHREVLSAVDLKVVAKVNLPLLLICISLIVQSLMLNELIWALANCSLRISAVEFLRVIVGVKPWARNACWCILIATIAQCVAVVLAAVRMCEPTQKIWMKDIPGTCGSEYLYYLFVEISNLLLDILVVFLPFPILCRLIIPARRRLALYFIFGAGSVVIILTGLHLHSLKELDYNDFSYSESYLGLLGLLALMVGIIATGGIIPIQAVIRAVIRSRRLDRCNNYSKSLRHVMAINLILGVDTCHSLLMLLPGLRKMSFKFNHCRRGYDESAEDSKC